MIVLTRCIRTHAHLYIPILTTTSTVLYPGINGFHIHRRLLFLLLMFPFLLFPWGTFLLYIDLGICCIGIWFVVLLGSSSCCCREWATDCWGGSLCSEALCDSLQISISIVWECILNRLIKQLVNEPYHWYRDRSIPPVLKSIYMEINASCK